ncbi:MAG: ShlB/FhaC/HecB family hemolysin secretion/activation protein, partial [Gemmataceae bacterium]
MTLKTIRISGATVYSQADFAPLIRPYLNRQITLVDLYRLADEITAKYRKDGYILSRALVPAQRINKVARIDVVEGYVSEVHFQGYDSPHVKGYANQIMASRPLQASVLERYLLLINDLSGVTGRAVLAPSPTVEGGTSLTIIAQQKEFDGSFSVDNRGTKYLGPIEFDTALGMNIPGLDDRLAVRYITTPSVRELQYGEMSLTHPIGDDGLRLVLYGNVVHTRPQYTLSPFDVFSDGDEASASLDYPLVRSRDQNLTVRGSFDLRDLITVVDNNRSLPPSSDDHLRVLRFGSTYDFADRFSGINLAALEFSQGLNILGASAEMRAVPSRPDAKSNFNKFRGEVSRQQNLAFIYPGLGLLTAAEGQVTNNGPLPASE